MTLRRRNITKAALLSAGLLGGLFSGEAGALTQRNSTVVTGNINYVTTGASFRTTAGNVDTGACTLKSATSLGGGFTRTSNAVSPARIAANTVPAGATVRAAYLYWTASAGESGYNGSQPLTTSSVKFYASGGAAPANDNVTAGDVWTGSTSGTRANGTAVTQYAMGAIADVTSIVRANPNAQYRMDELGVFNASDSATCTTKNVFANWALYIVYEDPSESTKTFSLYDGLDYVGGNSGVTSTTATLGGLRVPNAEAGTEKIAKTTIHVSDGDGAGSNPSSDTLRISTDRDAQFSVYNSLNSQTDVFNSSLTYGPAQGGTATGTTDAATVGGLDLDTFDVSSQVSAGARSLTATVNSPGTGELLVVYSMALMATSTTGDVTINKTGPATRNGAGNVTYTLTATNSGPNEAYNVVVSDPLPSGMTYVSNTGDGTYNSTNNTVTWNLGTLAAGASRTLTVTASVPGTAASYRNTASISSGSYDSNGNNNSFTATTTVLAPPTISKTYSPKTIPADGAATSTLTITLNNPNSSAITLTSALNDDIGSGLTITGVTDSCPGTATFSGTTITYPSGSTLNAGSCTITATVRSSTPGSYPNTIPAGALQTNVGSNAAAASDTLTVTPVTDLEVTKTDGVDSVVLGGTTGYTVRVTNRGPATVTGATLTDTPGTGLSLGSLTCTAAAGNTCTTNPSGSPVTLPTLAPGAFYEVRVAANVTGRDSNGNVVNTAVVAVPAGVTDTNGANDRATDTNTVTSNPPALTVSKAAGQASYNAGSNVTYTVTVTNSSVNTFTTGPLQLRDLLPSGMSLVSVSRSGGVAGTVGNVSPAGTTGEVGWTFTPNAGMTGGQSATFTVTASTRDDAAGGSLTNRVSVGGGGGAAAPDPATCETTGGQCAVATITLQAAPPPPITPNAIPQYSTCFDFSGISLASNGTTPVRSFTAPGGITVNYTVSRTAASRTSDGFVGGATLVNPAWASYFGTNANSLLTLDGTGGITNQTLSFNLRAWATLADGSAVPLTILTGSAESDGATAEYVQTTTDGTPFAAAYVNNSGTGQRVLQVDAAGTQARMQMEGSNLVVLATTKAATQANPLSITSTLGREWYNADTSQGFCTAFFPDYGDAPASYGTAAHLLEPGFSPTLAGVNTTTLAGVTAATLNATSPLRLGGNVSTEAQQRGTTAAEDTYDEGVSLPPLAPGSGNYAATVAYTNTTGANATVTGWVDFNGNGAFEAGEQATATVPAGSGNAALTWTSPNITVASGGTTYARFRIAPAAQAVSGTAPSGEVEDYALRVSGAPVLGISKAVSPTLVKVNDDPNDFSAPGSRPLPVSRISPQQVTYTLTVRNSGSAPANNVVVTDTLPAGLVFASATASTGGVATPVSNVGSATNLSLTLPSVAAGTQTVITVVTNVTEDPSRAVNTNQPAYTNTAYIGQTASNTVRTDVVYTKLFKQVHNLERTATATSPAVPVTSAEWFAKADGRPGDVLEYCIDFNNYGNTPLSGYSVTDRVPDNTTYLPGSAFVKTGTMRSSPVTAFPGSSVSEANGVITATIGTLAPQTTGSLCFRAAIK